VIGFGFQTICWLQGDQMSMYVKKSPKT
jgi:hypothetical protein